MSAFLVSGATLDAAVSAIWDHATDGRGILSRPLVVAHIVVNNRNDLQKLTTALLALNIAAMEERYPQDKGDHVPPHSFRQIEALDRVFGVKQAQCLLYQCAEGAVIETELFKALDSLVSTMCAEIVRKLPAYNAAPWGCREEHVNRGVVSLMSLATRKR